MTLAAVARVLGGDIEGNVLATTIGDLRAFVIRRVRSSSGVEVYDLVVCSPWTTDFRPWMFEAMHFGDGEYELPQLGNGYVFAGQRAGRMYATPVRDVTVGELVETLWKLASLVHQEEIRSYPRPDRTGRWGSERHRALVARLAFVVAVVLIALWIRH